jgi:UDP-N-acetylglucosamine 4-epimerase
LSLGQTVRVIDNFFSGHQDNLEAVAKSVRAASQRLEFMQGDIRQLSDCQAAVMGMQQVIHLAALGSVPLSMEKPLECH